MKHSAADARNRKVLVKHGTAGNGRSVDNYNIRRRMIDVSMTDCDLWQERRQMTFRLKCLETLKCQACGRPRKDPLRSICDGCRVKSKLRMRGKYKPKRLKT